VGKGVLTPVAGDPRELFEDAGLSRRNGTLHLGGVSLSRIAEQIGTPVYVYHAEAMRRRYRSLERAFAAVSHRICYAVKANANLAVLGVFRELGAGADIVSGGELDRALAAGFPPERIVFSGVGKTTAELEAALAAGVGQINLESLEEVERLGAAATRAGKDAAVGIRVNPDVTAETHPYVATGQSGIKFGIPADQVVNAARAISAHRRLKLVALAMHLGSQLTDPEPLRQGVARLAALVPKLKKVGGSTIASLDVGGGLGIRYGSEPGLEPERVAKAILPEIEATGLELLLEPGRYLVGSAGILLTQVLYRKHSGGKEFVVVDAGMNDLVRPSLYQAYHELAEVESSGRPEITADVVGPVCETGDFLALDRRLPDPQPGDRLAILGTGAYGFVMSSNYNSRPRPAEVLVDGDRFGLARPREKSAELFKQEWVEPKMRV
jgi:diaminopimelate decarboxylase